MQKRSVCIAPDYIRAVDKSQGAKAGSRCCAAASVAGEQVKDAVGYDVSYSILFYPFSAV